MSVTVAVDVRNVSKIYSADTGQAVTARDDVLVSIAQNKFFTLLDPSGCDKTNLVRWIGGFRRSKPDSIFLE